MPVLLRINHATTSLQPRAATGNGLSAGTIAGLVIACIFGLLSLLAIFWTCLLGSYIFTKAKNISILVVNKAERCRARAKNRYTAIRERSRQPPDLQNATQDVELLPVLRNQSVNSCSSKPIVVDAKRILGTDDASYLDEIASHGRKYSHGLIELGV